MAIQSIKSIGPNIMTSMGFFDSDLKPGSVTAERFVVLHSDGTFSVFRGTGITLDWLNFSDGSATGQITSVSHYSEIGGLIDRISDFIMPTSQIYYAINHGFWLYGPLSGDDVIRSNSLGFVSIDDTINAGLGNDTIRAGLGDDIVDGAFGNDLMYGGAGNDTLRGDMDSFETDTWKNGNDTMYGGSGDDTLYGCTGDDLLNGGRGTDTAVYDEAITDLAITVTATGFVITSASGTDTLTSIERLQTADGAFLWDATQQVWLPEITDFLA